eukprot:1997670-Alexandrium_andersonii.AAC.1
MSASLVGSEMCIRDRVSKVEPTGEAARRFMLGVCGGHLARARPHEQQHSCLLYTSDAADDM